MNDEEIDRLVSYAEGSYHKATNGENVGLVAWTARVQTALKFIPTLVTIIESLRRSIGQSRLREGRLDTFVDGNTTRTYCSTCGHTEITTRPADLRQDGQDSEMAADR